MLLNAAAAAAAALSASAATLSATASRGGHLPLWAAVPLLVMMSGLVYLLLLSIGVFDGLGRRR